MGRGTLAVSETQVKKERSEERERERRRFL
jgi:hypothetical protein